MAYIKVFGNEMGYVKLSDLPKNPIVGLRSSMSMEYKNILEYLAREREYEWQKNLVFLDSSITVPTVSGLPLKLSVNGSTSLMLKVNTVQVICRGTNNAVSQM